MTTTRTLRQRIATKVAHNLLAVLALIAVGVISEATASYEYQPDTRPVVPNSPAAVLADCHPVPEGAFPTAAVIRKTDGSAVMVTAPAKVSKAFDTALGERTWAGVSAVTLCR